MRVAVLFHRLGPYHAARLEAAARSLEIVALEMAAQTQEYAWSEVETSSGFERVTIFPEGESRGKAVCEVTQLVRSALTECEPAVVALPGWSNTGALAALQWCAEKSVPSIVMSESTADDEPRVNWREAVKKRLLTHYSSGLAGGQLQRDYLVDLGMPREHIALGYDAVDNGYFAQRGNEVRSKNEEVRRGYGLPENFFLASARFIEKKNLFRLLEAYAAYRRRAERNPKPKLSDVSSQLSAIWDLVLLGDGPLREALSSQISALGLSNHVHLPGFKQYGELPHYYANAKVFVHASTSEQWGLVVNEAMASGLPVLVSERCGCAPDLVENGRNGFTFDPADSAQLADLMLAMTQSEDLAKMGAASSEIIAHWGPDRFAAGLAAAARKAIEVGPKRRGLVDRLLLEVLMRR